MNQCDFSSCSRLLDLLSQGARVHLPEAGLLAAMDSGIIRVSSRQYTARMSIKDFCELYGGLSFCVLGETEGISEQKDEEYYAWRRVKQ